MGNFVIWQLKPRGDVRHGCQGQDFCLVAGACRTTPAVCESAFMIKWSRAEKEKAEEGPRYKHCKSCVARGAGDATASEAR
jgi:hypothetical protein